jgi:DNA-binding beta-propeller fold protein YncE
MSVFRILVSLVLLSSCGYAQNESSSGVEFVIGGLMQEEGGDWDPKSSPLLRPFGVDFDLAGCMFVVELEGGRVHRFDPDGKLTQISGDGSESYKGDGGLVIDATYNGMHNIAVIPDGDLYIADSWNHCIRRIERDTGIVSTFAGTGKPGFSGDGGPATKAAFDFIMCITLNSTNDVLHVAELKNRRIRAIDLESRTVTTIVGNGQKGAPADSGRAVESPLEDPRAVAADSKGNVYVLERGGNALRVVMPDGKIQTVAGTGKQGFRDGAALEAQFGSPKHICIDDKDNVYIADDQNKAIRRFDPVAKTVSTVLGRGQGDAKLKLLHPHGVCWEAGWLYVVDTSHNRILRIKP